MNKEQFFKAIDGVDDKLLKDVFDVDEEVKLTEAETLHGTTYRPEPRPRSSRRRAFAAAAACAAVLGVESFAAVKMMNSQSGILPSDSTLNAGISLAAADSGHSDPINELTSSSSSIDDTSDNPDIDMKFNYNIGDKFEYEGKTYKTISSSAGGGGNYDENGEEILISGDRFIIGVRREIIDNVDTVMFTAFVENIGTVPIGLMSSTATPDKPVILRFVLNNESISYNWVDDYEFKYMPVILQPGEKYYQTASFPVTEAEYMFSYCLYETDPKIFDESKSFKENRMHSGGYSNRLVDFSDMSVSFDDVDKLFTE